MPMTMVKDRNPEDDTSDAVMEADGDMDDDGCALFGQRKTQERRG